MKNIKSFKLFESESEIDLGELRDKISSELSVDVEMESEGSDCLRVDYNGHSIWIYQNGSTDGSLPGNINKELLKLISENEEHISDDAIDKIISEFCDEKSDLSRSIKNMPINGTTEPILSKLQKLAKEHGYLSEQMVYDALTVQERNYLENL